jgi:hypothetical protein
MSKIFRETLNVIFFFLKNSGFLGDRESDDSLVPLLPRARTRHDLQVISATPLSSPATSQTHENQSFSIVVWTREKWGRRRRTTDFQ